MTLVIHDGVLYILGVTTHAGAEHKSVRAPVIKKDGLMVVSGQDPSGALYHINNRNKSDYRPRGTVLEIHDNGSVFRFARQGEKGHGIAGIDSKGTFISGSGRKQILAALDLCEGDVRKAIQHATRHSTALKPNTPVYVYNLPKPIATVEPDDTFLIDA